MVNKKLCSLILIGCFAFSAHAQIFPGVLDSTFGINGKVTSAFNAFDCEGKALAIQADGKMVVVGSSNNGTFNQFAVARFNLDGSPDASFGTNGKVVTVLSTGNNIARAVKIQPDGKIVVAGNIENLTYSRFGVARYNSDGTLDNTFGSGGKVITALDLAFDLAYGVALQPDGKIVAAGISYDTLFNGEFAIVRYNANGSLDNGFGIGGKVRTSLGTQTDQANCVALDPVTNKIVLGGRTSSAFALARYNTNGVLDPTFGNGGIVTYFIGTQSDVLNTILVQPDGKIIGGGSTQAGTNFDFALMRFSEDGSLDPDFGVSGITINDFGGTDILYSLQFQNEYLIGAGSTSLSSASDFMISRYDSLGNFDALFNMQGFNQTHFTSGSSGATDIAYLQPDKILACGTVSVAGVNNLALARYNADFTFVGIDDVKGGIPYVAVQPNPANDRVTLSSDDKMQSIVLKNMAGQTIQTYFPDVFARNYSINTQSLIPGIYFINVQSANKVLTHKIVVQH
jgi:uncharacterized delta-60 repeat protein